MYEVLTTAYNVGFIVGYSEKKTLFFLNSANRALSSTTPVSSLDGVVHDLRMAVEWAIDEVVFRGLSPNRYKGSQNIDWAGMRDMASAGIQNVVDLKRNYDDLSSMGAHVGASSYVVTPTPAKLQAIHDDILRIYRSVYP